MEVSQYNQPAQSNVVNTYSPIPFQEMMQAGMMKQKEQEQGLDQLGKMADETYNIKYIPNSVDEQYVKQHVIPKAQEIVSKYSSMDLTDPVIRRQMMSEFNTNIDKNRVKSIQDSAQGWQQYQAGRQKLQLEDKLDPNEVDVSHGWDSSQHGTFNNLPTPYSDPILEIRKNLFEPLHDSTLSTHKDDAGNYFIKSGVNDKTIQDVTKANLANYLSTAVGKRAIRNYRKSTGLTEDEASDVQLLAQAFKDAGEPYKRNNEKVEHLAQETASSPTDPTNNPYKGQLKTQYINNQALATSDKVKAKLGFDPTSITNPQDIPNTDKYGQLIEPKKPEVVRPHQGDIGMSGQSSDMGVSAKSATIANTRNALEYAEKTKQYTEQLRLVRHLKQNSPALANATPQMVLHAYAKAYQEAQHVSHMEYLYKNLPGGQNIQAQTSETVLQTLGERKLMSAQTGTKSTKSLPDWESLMNNLGVGTKDRAMENGMPKNAQITGFLPSAGMYKGTIATVDGPKSFLVSANEHEQDEFAEMKAVHEIANNGGVGDKPVPGSDLVVRTKLAFQDGKPTFVHDVLNPKTNTAVPISMYDAANVQYSITHK